MTAIQVIRQIKKLPDREQAKVRSYVFRSHVPNSTTRKVLRDTMGGNGLVRCTDAEELFAKLKIYWSDATQVIFGRTGTHSDLFG